MQESRRNLLMGLVGAAGMAALGPSPQHSGGVTPQPIPSPNAPKNQNAPAGLDNAGVGQADDKATAMARENLKLLKADVEKLFDKSTELKEQVETTNLNSILPVTIVKQAKEIEKLAKDIRERAKG
jgi:hypothetical protein